MSKWPLKFVQDIADFNPRVSLPSGTICKKIPMGYLQTFNRKITGFETATYSSGPKFCNGDTLLAKITPCLENGKTALVDILSDDEVAFGSSEFIVLRSRKGNDSQFLYYLAISPAFRKRAISCMEGTSGRKRVNEKALKIQKLPIPELHTQQKIAAVLSSLDAKIELNNRINAELEAMAKTLYDYWFVQFDFPDKSGKPYKSSGGGMTWNSELKRDIPKGWSSVIVSKILAKETASIKIQTSEILAEGEIPVIDQSTDYIAGFTNNIQAVNKCVIPRIIFGDHTRILKLINFDFARGADGTQVMLSNSDNMPQHLLYHTLLKIDLSNYGYARHYKFLKDQKIILPDEGTAKNFDILAHSYYTLIKHNIFENRSLSSLRDWLLPMLMNGQVKVS